MILLISFLCVFGVTDLNPYIWFNWTYPTDETVKFTIGVDTSQYDDTKWVGLGLKSPYGYPDMSDADIVTFYMGSINKCQDRYSVSGTAYPPIDTYNNINCTDREFLGNTYYYSWTRKINTTDTQDYNFNIGDRVMVIWAQGPLTGGDIGYHGSTSVANSHGHLILYLTRTSTALLSVSISLYYLFQMLI